MALIIFITIYNIFKKFFQLIKNAPKEYFLHTFARSNKERMHLEFEKPIIELESKLSDMKELAQQSEVDVSDAITKLENKILKLAKLTQNHFLY